MIIRKNVVNMHANKRNVQIVFLDFVQLDSTFQLHLVPRASNGDSFLFDFTWKVIINFEQSACVGCIRGLLIQERIRFELNQY